MNLYEYVNTVLFLSVAALESRPIAVAIIIAAVAGFIALRKLQQTENSFRNLIELSPDAMLVRRHGTIIFANPACLELFRASSVHELVGKQFLDLVHPDDRDDIRERMKSLGEDLSRPPVRSERKYITLDGHQLDVEVVVKTFMYKGKPAIQVILHDISERKRAEEKLRRSEANLAAAQRIAHLGSWEQDITNLRELGEHPLRWSDEVYRIFGYEPGQTETVQELFRRAVHPDDRERLGSVAKGTHANNSFSVDYRIVRPCGDERLVHSEGHVVYDEKTNKPVKMIGTVQDITERIRAVEGLRQHAAIVESSNDAILGITLNGIITNWNASAERMFGFSANEAIGQPVTILTAPDQSREPLEMIAKLERGETIAKFETTRIRKDRSPIHVAITVSPIKNENFEIMGSSAIIRDITESKKAEERFYKAFNLNPEPMTIATMSEGRYVDVNESFLRVSGYQREEVIGRTSLELNFWERREDRERLLEMLNKQGSVRDLEITFRTKSGGLRAALDSADVFELAGVKCILAIFKDVTEQKILEKQLRQAQKMEAIGQFSGGIAHDFNNLLGVIIGYSELLEENLDQGTGLRKHAEEIKKAGQRAASLTRQILAFSRQQVLAPKVLNLNAVVADTEKMLRRLISRDIELTTVLNPAVGQVKADQGQIEQVIMNLAVNARDAMPDGGKLIITTENKTVDEEYARRHSPSVPGDYVVLDVTDTGLGMGRETQLHIFEPFFTTKELGKGTGLGLATVYGVVKQSGGYIWVYSEPGIGTTFKIYLPRVDQAVPQNRASDSAAGSLRGSETILLVEDEAPLRMLTRTLLEQSGYNVLEAGSSSQAAEIALHFQEPIHLLLTDMVMPGMNGRAIAEKLRQIRPEIKVIFMSGYTGFTPRGELDSEALFLAKPVTLDALLRKVHEGLSFQKVPAATKSG